MWVCNNIIHININTLEQRWSTKIPFIIYLITNTSMARSIYINGIICIIWKRRRCKSRGNFRTSSDLKFDSYPHFIRRIRIYLCMHLRTLAPPHNVTPSLAAENCPLSGWSPFIWTTTRSWSISSLGWWASSCSQTKSNLLPSREGIQLYSYTCTAVRTMHVLLPTPYYYYSMYVCMYY